MQLKLTAKGKQGAGKTDLLKALVIAGVAAGVLPSEALNIEPENIKGQGGKLRERITIDLPDVGDGKVG